MNDSASESQTGVGAESSKETLARVDECVGTLASMNETLWMNRNNSEVKGRIAAHIRGEGSQEEKLKFFKAVVDKVGRFPSSKSGSAFEESEGLELFFNIIAGGTPETAAILVDDLRQIDIDLEEATKLADIISEHFKLTLRSNPHDLIRKSSVVAEHQATTKVSPGQEPVTAEMTAGDDKLTISHQFVKETDCLNQLTITEITKASEREGGKGIRRVIFTLEKKGKSLQVTALGGNFVDVKLDGQQMDHNGKNAKGFDTALKFIDTMVQAKHEEVQAMKAHELKIQMEQRKRKVTDAKSGIHDELNELFQ